MSNHNDASIGLRRPGRWRPIQSSLASLLLVSVDSETGGTAKRRLSLLGHTLLTSSLFLTAAAGFLASLAITQASINQWDPCPQREQPQGSGSSRDSGARREAQRSAEAKEMIASLAAASRSQRQRLLQQRQEMEAARESFCLVSHSFQIQFAAFTSVGTAAAILVTISMATIAPDGLKTNNRTLLNVLMSAGIILAISVIYPQTFSAASNENEATLAYQQATNLIYTFTSSLANQQISTTTSNPTTHTLTPLNSTGNIAALIRSNDEALAQLISAKLNFNNQFASKTLKHLNSQTAPTSPHSAPAPSPSASSQPAAAGAQASP